MSMVSYVGDLSILAFRDPATSLKLMLEWFAARWNAILRFCHTGTQ